MFHIGVRPSSENLAEQRRAIVEAFQQFDKDQDGYLSKHEAKCTYTAVVGSKPTKACINLLMQKSDEGLVGLTSMTEVLQAVLQSRDPDDHIRQVFKAFDLRYCGFISREDAHAVFKNAAPAVSSRVVDEVFDELDLDHDGRVGGRDFIAMMRMRHASIGKR